MGYLWKYKTVWFHKTTFHIHAHTDTWMPSAWDVSPRFWATSIIIPPPPPIRISSKPSFFTPKVKLRYDKYISRTHTYLFYLLQARVIPKVFFKHYHNTLASQLWVIAHCEFNIVNYSRNPPLSEPISRSILFSYPSLELKTSRGKLGDTFLLDGEAKFLAIVLTFYWNISFTYAYFISADFWL